MVKASGGVAYGYRCDLTNREEIYKVAESVTKEIGQVTILINNAGFANEKFLLDTPDELIRRTFDVNILAHFWTVKAFLRKMIENNHGHIVTIASLAGHVGVHNLVDYCSSKFAAVGFDEALRIELEKLGADGVKTTVVCPYFIQATGMFNHVQSKFVSTLKSTQVADEIVTAIQMEKISVIIPGYLRFVFLKWIFPWSVVSLFLKSVINSTPASSPEVLPSDNDNTKKEEINFQKITENELKRRIRVDDEL
ncbi:hypothetical protein FQA39_LY01437 [Lamprigera yunnana]|nr:hypothetical protein FQA39_LY01437 [Lamprigera yunnana]